MIDLLIRNLRWTSFEYYTTLCRSKWPRGLKRGSAAARLLRLRVRIPPGFWTSVSCECCVLSVRGLCDQPITRPEESYQVWCVSEYDHEAPTVRRPWLIGAVDPSNAMRNTLTTCSWPSANKQPHLTGPFLRKGRSLTWSKKFWFG